MKKIIKSIAVINLITLLSGCATEVLKAPCDQQGHFCGHKIKINHW